VAVYRLGHCTTSDIVVIIALDYTDYHSISTQYRINKYSNNRNGKTGQLENRENKVLPRYHRVNIQYWCIYPAIKFAKKKCYLI